MSLFSGTYDATYYDPAAQADEHRARSVPERPIRRVTGPVLMGDIHTAPGGRPMLLTLWEQWEAAARER